MSYAAGGMEQEKTKETNIILRRLFEDRVEKDAKNDKLKQGVYTGLVEMDDNRNR